MRTIILANLLIISTLSAFSQTTDSTNLNPDWMVKPKRQAGQLMTPQQKPKPEWVQKLRYGGNFWASIYNGAYIEVSPMVGYPLNEKGLIGGVGLNMIYNNYQTINSSGQLGRDASFDFGFRVFLQQQIFKMFFLQGEIETMNARSLSFYDGNFAPDPFARKWEIYPLVGIGFHPGRIRGGQSGYYFALMYNPSYPNSGYIGTGSLGGGLTLRVGFF